MKFSDIEYTAARAILAIERELEPTCEICYVGVNRSLCPNGLGGGCAAHTQEDAVVFRRVVRELEKSAGLDRVPLWRQKVDLKHVVNIDEHEKALMQDLLEAPHNRVHSRSPSILDMYRSPIKKNITFAMSKGGYWYVTLTRRGKEWAEEMFGGML